VECSKIAELPNSSKQSSVIFFIFLISMPIDRLKLEFD